MSTQHISISLKTDKQGFITQACGHCHEHFKVSNATHDALEYCPFCGKKPPEGDGFLTAAQMEYAKSVILGKFVEPELQRIDDAFENLGSVGGVTVTGERDRLQSGPTPVETEDDMASTTTSACCSFTVRHETNQRVGFCGACSAMVTA